MDMHVRHATRPFRLAPLASICLTTILQYIGISSVYATSVCVLSSNGECTHYRTDSYFESSEAAEEACLSLLASHGYPASISCFNSANYVKTPNYIEADYAPGIDYPYTLGFFHFSFSCASGEYRHPQKGCISYDESKNEGENQCVGNPINMLSGNKFQEETFFKSPKNPNFQVSFFYNSVSGQWRTPFSSSIQHSFETPVIAEVERSDGQQYYYEFDGTDWNALPDITGTLVELSDANGFSGWELAEHNQIKTYDTQGRLVSLEALNEQSISLVYDDVAFTTIVTDQRSGDTLVLYYDNASPDRLVQMTDPEGQDYFFSYNSEGMLEVVTYPDDTSGDPNDNPQRTYHYEDTNFPAALTGITDEKGNRFATWVYDSQGRAISSEHANTGSGIDKVTLDYTYINDATDPRVTVTNELGKQTTYHYTTIHGVRKVTQVEGHASANCAAANQSYTYDANGFRDEVTDWEGNVTDYDHDARGLEVQRIEAKGSPQERTITTQWHADYRLPIKITEPDRVIDFVYDASGQLLERNETPVP